MKVKLSVTPPKLASSVAVRVSGTTGGGGRAALKSLFSTGAPVDDIETMIEESIAGRLR